MQQVQTDSTAEPIQPPNKVTIRTDGHLQGVPEKVQR